MLSQSPARISGSDVPAIAEVEEVAGPGPARRARDDQATTSSVPSTSVDSSGDQRSSAGAPVRGAGPAGELELAGRRQRPAPGEAPWRHGAGSGRRRRSDEPLLLELGERAVVAQRVDRLADAVGQRGALVQQQAELLAGLPDLRQLADDHAVVELGARSCRTRSAGRPRGASIWPFCSACLASSLLLKTCGSGVGLDHVGDRLVAGRADLGAELGALRSATLVAPSIFDALSRDDRLATV